MSDEDSPPIPQGRRELTLVGLDAVLALMRKHGVTSFKTAIDGSPMEVAFGILDAPAGGPQPVDSAPMPCECGHTVAEHNADGECLRGCPASKCSL